MTRTPGAGLLNVGYLVDNDISEQGRRQRDTCGRLTRFGGATQTRTEDLSIIRAGESFVVSLRCSQRVAKRLVNRTGQPPLPDWLRQMETTSDATVGTDRASLEA